MASLIASIYAYLANFFSASPTPTPTPTSTTTTTTTTATAAASPSTNPQRTSRPALDGPSLSTLLPYPPTEEESLYPPCPLDGEIAMSASVEQLVKEAKMAVPKDA